MGVTKQMISVHMRGAMSACKALTDLEFNARRRVVTAAVRSANVEVVREAKAAAPSRTGLMRKQLRASIKMYRNTGLVYATIRVRATAAQKAKKNVAWYVNIVIGGSKPHLIKPSTKRSLAIGDNAVRSVQHPGTKPNPFLEEAASAAFSEAIAAFEKTLAEKLTVEADKVYREQRL